MNGGAKTWYFPDGYLPEKSQEGKMEAHEALMLLNTGIETVNIKIDIYFENHAPIRDISVSIDGERIKTLRLDKPCDIGGVILPVLTQYSLRIRADKNIIAQFGRLDTTQNNMAYYGVMGCWE